MSSINSIDWDSIGKKLDDQRKVSYLGWLLTKPSEREPKFQAGIAEKLGVSARTLRDWQAQPEFLKLWRACSVKVIGSPEKTQQVMEALFETATGTDDKGNPFRDRVAAAKTWLSAADSITPPEEKGLGGAPDLSSLSDDELAAIAARLASAELKSRQPLRAVPSGG